MPYKNVLVHVEPTDEGRTRTRAAAAIARTFQARLIGVAARSFEHMPDPIGLSVVHLKELIAEDLRAAEEIFKQSATGLPSTVWHADVGSPTTAVLKYAAGVDLIVACVGVEGDPIEKQAGTADLIMGAGLPVLMVPPGAKVDFGNVLIGWKNTREARRAISDAMPFLLRARKVKLVCFGSEADRLDDIADRLQAHGINAEKLLEPEDLGSVVERIQSEAKKFNAGLIVAGGYGHSRMREWALGGVTRELLSQQGTCVLFSH